MALVLDTGVLYASLDRSDVHLNDIVRGAYKVEPLDVDDYRRVAEVCDQYSDSEIGFVDAAVLAIVERLREPKLASIDHRHFGLLRPRHVEALTLLPQ